MYLFKLFLTTPLNYEMAGIKDLFKSNSIDQSFQVELNEIAIDKIIETWNSRLGTKTSLTTTILYSLISNLTY